MSEAKTGFFPLPVGIVGLCVHVGGGMGVVPGLEGVGLGNVEHLNVKEVFTTDDKR